MARERLDKLLAAHGCGSRKEVGALVRAGRVCVDGAPQRDPGAKIDPAACALTVDGDPLILREQRERYFMLNKPAGLLSATEDNFQPTVLSLLPEGERRGLFPVGRLDKDTEGLLLLTDDGSLGHALTAPRRHVDKVYLAHIAGGLDADTAARFEAGITLADGTVCRPARFEETGAEDGLLLARITVHEGRFHQVKRMVQAVGGRVMKLKRLSMGPLTLDEYLAPGEYRPLTADELAALRAACTPGTDNTRGHSTE